VTAVHVWRPLAKKSKLIDSANWHSTANGRLVVDSWTYYLATEIFSCIEVENRHFRTLYFDL